MRILPPILCAIALILAATADGQGVYKCTNPDGSVSFQDRACPESADEKKVSVGSTVREETNDYEGIVFAVPGVGDAAVMVFDYMETVVREDGDRAITLGIRSRPGARHKMSMMLTFMPNLRGTIPSQDRQVETVKRIAMQTTGGFIPSDLEIHEFQAQTGTGLFTIIPDPSYPNGAAPDGEYATMTAGQIVDEKVVIAITILTDGIRGKGFTDALAIVETFVIAPGIIAIDHAGGDLDLPEPPPGFTWQQAPDIKGAILKPDGWYFDTEFDGDDYGYFISREPNAPPDGFDTGLTLNVITDVPSKTGVTASTYAAAFIEGGGSEFQMIGEPFSGKRGPYESHGALFQVADPGRGDFKAHMVAIANDQTGTVYLCIFEGPAEDWDLTWRIGEQMLEKLVIDSSI